jgi:hypothetical protein
VKAERHAVTLPRTAPHGNPFEVHTPSLTRAEAGELRPELATGV